MCGPEFIIDVRISGDEYSDGGLNLNDAIYVSKQLEKTGVDMLHVSGGTTIKRGSSIPAPGTKMGSHSALSAEIKKHVSIPVATVGRITEPWLDEELIANDKADICMIGRANLCEPEFCNKAQAGHIDEIRPCIGCLRCLNGIMFGNRIACTVNPSFEPENEETLTTAETKKNVLVIGGGPAGMEAAFVAAKRGHHVILADKQDALGGTVRIAAVPIAKQDLTQLIKYQAHKLEQVGVEVLLNTEVTLDMIKTDYADYEIILCGGAAPIVPGFMTEFKDYMTADDVLYGRKFPGHKIVVIGGGSVGCETADYLAPVLNDRFPKNREIILIEMAHEIMANESGPGRSLLVQRMMEKGIQIICDAKVEEVSNDTISYSKDGSTHQITDADTLVLAMGYRSNATLQEQLTETGISYSVLGDCKQLGNIKDAISQGYELARTL